jgi:hypothetical protein
MHVRFVGLCGLVEQVMLGPLAKSFLKYCGVPCEGIWEVPCGVPCAVCCGVLCEVQVPCLTMYVCVCMYASMYECMYDLVAFVMLLRRSLLSLEQIIVEVPCKASSYN